MQNLLANMNGCIVLIGLLGICCTPVLTQRFLRQEQLCYTPENNYGVCVTLSTCPSIVNYYSQSRGSPAAVQYLRAVQRSCGTRSVRGDPVICCGEAYQRNRNPATRPTAPVTAPPTPPPTTTTTTTTTTTPAPIIDDRATSCRGPDLAIGTCVDLRQCTPLITRLTANPTDQSFASFLRLSNEICYKTTKTVVCCPNSDTDDVRGLDLPTTQRPAVTPNTPGENDAVTRLPTLEEGCGLSNNTYRKIVGGEASKIGAWPWIALIGYDDQSPSASPFKCGGSLITRKHVLTAAHCILSSLRFVRLGEHDLTIETETRHVDIPVVKSVRHPSYNRRNGHSDIAVLYLQRSAPLSLLIVPACLPYLPQLRSKSYVDYSPFVAGWGKTMEGGASANILQELQIPILPNSVCNDRYRQLQRLITEDQFDDAVLCAGILTGGKDTCQGDSGGPLMIPEPYERSVRFNIIGVVAYGIGCARSDIPSAYTSVQHFMDWIIQQVATLP